MNVNSYSNFITQAIDFLNPSFEIKLVSFFVCVLAVLINLYLRSRMSKLGPVGTRIEIRPETIPSVKENGITARWSEIQRHVQSDREAEWKFAIIEADKLLSDILAEIGVPGDTLGERLNQINSSQLNSIEDLWEAHKVRNKIAHDSEFFLRDTEARRVVGLFEKVLRELEAI